MPEATTLEPELTVELATGRLTLRGADPDRLAQLCAFAARANPKRGFLIVSRVLGRHLPTRPGDFRASAAQLAARLPGDLAAPVVFLGMAETATALAQAVWAAWRAQHPGAEVDAANCYLQTSRQRAEGAQIIARFEEGHSHATSHLIQLADPALIAVVRRARTLVIVDDECSTGGTFRNAASAMAEELPELEAVHCLSLTDWSGGSFLAHMPAPAQAHSLLSGEMEWQAAPRQFEAVLAGTANRHGTAPATGMRSRTGLGAPEAARRETVAVRPGERMLVLGDGEHSYEAVLIAEEIERAGGIAAVQSITRTPALLGHAIQSVAVLEDAYGSGATCHLYNALAHHPERIVIASEVGGDIAGAEARQLRDWLSEQGSSILVEWVECAYGDPP